MRLKNIDFYSGNVIELFIAYSVIDNFDGTFIGNVHIYAKKMEQDNKY